LMSWPRTQKKRLMQLMDLCMFPTALMSAFVLQHSTLFVSDKIAGMAILFVATPAIGIALMSKLGLYREIIRYMGKGSITSVTAGAAFLGFFTSLLAYVAGLQNYQHATSIIYSLIAVVYIGGSRLLLRGYFTWFVSRFGTPSPVVIYGAGDAGRQLTYSLGMGSDYYVVAYLDDDRTMIGNFLNGLPVYSPKDLGRLIEEYQLSHVLLALNNLTPKRKAEIIDDLARYPIHVKTIPTVSEMIQGASQDILREIAPEELLGRDPVPANKGLLRRSIANKVVLVTGAGGSIGSELCRQIILNGASHLILLELSEHNLYLIEKQLNEIRKEHNLTSTQITSYLCSISDAAKLNEIFTRHMIQTVYHAAAYKHVPIVETNVHAGIQNNIFGTVEVAQASLKFSVERFVLVSTDKAVRPTNMMGATKRLAELAVKKIASSQENSSTTFSTVRFGNVLGSSGSVVPLFKQQIEKMGPVTVTHPEVTRYFMTIPEAASLVIQAGSMADNGDVFVLDMGEPIKIVDLAVKMIHLMGYEPRLGHSESGDIELIFTGLRPGEKLYEELLIDGSVIGTEHSKILKAGETPFDSAAYDNFVNRFQSPLVYNDELAMRKLLRESVEIGTSDAKLDVFSLDTNIRSSDRRH